MKYRVFKTNSYHVSNIEFITETDSGTWYWDNAYKDYLTFKYKDGASPLIFMVNNAIHAHIVTEVPEEVHVFVSLKRLKSHVS